jgi:hypothetical protein
MNAWDILKLAISEGWTDPGYTEPLDDTVGRAIDYLRTLTITD